MAGARSGSRHWNYEHRKEPLASRKVFARRVLAHFAVGFAVVMVALALGMTGYRATEGMSWLDAFLNASMILSGMGPVAELHTVAGKLFAGAYSLFAGVVFLVVVGMMSAPMAHRLLHRIHLDDRPEP